MVRLIYFFYIFINAFLLSFQDKSGYSLCVWFGPPPYYSSVNVSPFIQVFFSWMFGIFLFCFSRKKEIYLKVLSPLLLLFNNPAFCKEGSIHRYTTTRTMLLPFRSFLQFWNVGAYIYFRFIPVQGKSLGLPPFASQMRKLRLHVLVFNLVEQ